MSNPVASYLLNAFSSLSRVDMDVLHMASLYAKRSLGVDEPLVGVSEDIGKLFEEETYDKETAAQVKHSVIEFAATASDARLFVAAVGVLRVFRDPKIVPLLVTWLDRHLRLLLEHNGAVSQLLYTLQDCGASTPFRQSSGVWTVESNIDVARKYLAEVLGTQYSW